MAGGKGTRISSIAGDIPKPMIPVCGKPILERQIECLKKNGLTEIIIVVGHLGGHIKDYFKDGSLFGCNISYFTETEPLGTAGALFKLENLCEDFILLNGDLIFDIDFSRMIEFHREKKAWATIAVHPNDHPYDSALIETNSDCQVTLWLNKEDERMWYKNRVNAGIHILSAVFLENCRRLSSELSAQNGTKTDLDRDMLKPSISSEKIFAYSTPEYIKDMGTPIRYAQVTSDIENGNVMRKNLSVKQKCVFLDRDGTVNAITPGIFIKELRQFELIDGVWDAVKKINSLGYLAIIITNQPVVARGETDIATLDLIHMKLETGLGKHGAYIDDLFYCPHHPNRGFEGELPEYKIECDCRKPKPGMILKAAEKYNIDLSASWMIGDDIRDVKAGKAAGCKTALITDVKTGMETQDAPDIFCSSVKEFTEGYLR